MNELLVYYLLIAAAQTLPLFFFTLLLISSDTSRPILQEVLGARVIRILRRFARASQSEQLFYYLDSETRSDFVMLSLIICVLEFMIMAFVTLAVVFNAPVPFVVPVPLEIPHVNTNETLLTDVMYDLVMFSATTSILHLIPIGFLLFAFLLDVLLSFILTPTENPTPLSNIITGYNLQIRDFDSIHFIRFEKSEQIIIFASSSSGTLIFFQTNDPNARTLCYFCEDDDTTLHRVLSPLFTVNQLDEIIFSNE